MQVQYRDHQDIQITASFSDMSLCYIEASKKTEYNYKDISKMIYYDECGM